MDKIADKRDTSLARFHQASWNEPIIYELSVKGQRGVLVPQVSETVSYTHLTLPTKLEV